ncbi:MauE/DoxX family redox-associated membrane protein [Streptomyces iconiensis]|uniref:Methylamine utilisation protein MauE domain-containing protein n=1 Tax=Streptomyces iconiensis TaxID=1384038 RepID=A0ABT7A9B7_9ACTN|nr:MauE/DoxX family redox-associated membrane protein [Streptomyces iconiensis]MDJ1137958.1 hypothetical protein [Streptomyces iconiensis]
MQQYLEVAVRTLIGTVFLASFLSKAKGRQAYGIFVASVSGMRVLPPVLVRPVAAGVVAGELLVSLLATTPSTVAGVFGLLGATALLGGFALAIVLARHRGVSASCRCFGASSAPLGVRHVVRNSVLGVLAVIGAVSAPADGAVRVEAAVTAALCGLLLAAVVMALDDIAALFVPA